MAVITNIARILPDKISAAETTALMYLAEHTVVDPEYNHHKILPVIIFTMSERRVRIVQGCFDLEKRVLDIGMSRILDFSTFLMTPQSRPDFYQLLGWFTSEPVGRTT